MTDPIQQERFADAMRQVSTRIHDAIVERHEAEADLKRLVAQKMIAAESEGFKSHNAQSRQADVDVDVHTARIHLGVAEAKVTALKVEWKRVEIAFEKWRTEQANIRLERKSYGA